MWQKRNNIFQFQKKYLSSPLHPPLLCLERCLVCDDYSEVIVLLTVGDSFTFRLQSSHKALSRVSDSGLHSALVTLPILEVLLLFSPSPCGLLGPALCGVSTANRIQKGRLPADEAEGAPNRVHAGNNLMLAGMKWIIRQWRWRKAVGAQADVWRFNVSYCVHLIIVICIFYVF